MDINAESADQKSAAPAAGRDDTGLARTDALQPAAPDRGRDAESTKKREHPAHAGDAPVADGGEQLLHSDMSGQALVAVSPIARDNGSQNTLKP